MTHRKLLFALVGGILLLTAGLLAAQAPHHKLFAPTEYSHAMPYVEEYGWVVAGDFDRDGDVDAILASSYAPCRLFLNRHGRFTDAAKNALPDGAHQTVDQGVVTGDIDGDGDLDVLISRGDWSAKEPALAVWINNGHGKFKDRTSQCIPTIHCRPVLLLDVDGDKDLDLICGCSGKQNLLLLNDGAGHFTDYTTTHMPADTDHAFCFAAGDVNGDGYPDLAIGNWSNPTPHAVPDRLYLNDGHGKFSVAPAANFPTTATEARGLNLFDWDGDKDLDLIVAEGTHYNPLTDRLYLNDGNGKFQEDTTGMLPVVAAGSRTYLVADADGDGDLDLFTPQTGQSRLLRNDGAGQFTDVTAATIPEDTNRTRTGVFIDLDGDRDPDLLVSSANRLALLRNHRGVFKTWFYSWMPYEAASGEGVAFGDVDGDGDQDAVFACYPVYPDMPFNNKLYLNNGFGRFTNESGRLPVDSDASTSVVLVDVDGDKDLDIVFGNEGPTKLYLNDGSGYFTDVTATQMPGTPAGTYGLEVGDVNGDGYPDLVLANWGQNFLYLNDGNGKFSDATAGRLPVRGEESRGLELGDVDGDGDLDLLVGNGFFYDRENRLLINNGVGVFTDAPVGSLPPVADVTLDLVMGDIDGDGDLDFYEATGIDPYDVREDHLYVNDGKGKFTEVTKTRMPGIEAGRTFCAEMLDVDGDGDLDIYTSRSHYFADVGAQNGLWLNNGKGKFKDATSRLPRCYEHGNWLAVGDVDGDGDPDVLTASYYPPQLFVNRSRTRGACHRWHHWWRITQWWKTMRKHR